jgi:hypothetical protein
MDSKIAEAVLRRANGYCEKCGSGGDNFALHHRKLKSRGGVDCVANLIAVHHECHNLGTNSIHNQPAQAKLKGWMVPSWADPAEYPLHLPDGTVVRLDRLGNYLRYKDGKWQQ